jgi:phosphoinositide-3-kinase, regulatory subunit 4
MLFLSCYLTDEAKLDRLIPYVVDLLHDDAAVVRAAAVRTILQVVIDSKLVDMTPLTWISTF